MQEKYIFQKENETNTDLFIYGEIMPKSLWTRIIEKEYDVESSNVSALSFKEALELVDTQNLTVHINSMGGSVSEGLAIYNLLNSFKGKVTTIVDGFACSAASVIFMAGEKRIVPESGLLMIHNAWSYTEGDSNAMRKAADDLEKITQPSVNIYASKTKLEESKIKKMMDEETWLTSKEAFDLCFATSVEKDDAKQSLENHYLHKMVVRLKEFENQSLENKNKVVAPQIENKSSLDDFFS